MQTTLDVILSKKYLTISLIVIAAINLAANLISQDLATLVGNLGYIPITGAFLILSLLIASRFGLTGNHGLAWFSFAAFAVSWFIAEMLWIHQELVLKEDPFPSAADIFYIVGYPFLLMFFVAYLQPVRAAITKKILGLSSAVSIGVLVPSLYLVLSDGVHTDSLNVILGAIYPIFDAMVIIPAIIGVVLFFKGQVNFMWTLVCLGTICLFAADTAFLFGQNEDLYYTGNPAEILFYWNYVFLAFGVHNHLTLFKKEKKSKKAALE
ncbi:MAG: hypothetical protein JRZ94_06270 [Nitrososphaerota archaeon]|nr:hypothetical protein [Nitrososphaerota archaeon]